MFGAKIGAPFAHNSEFNQRRLLQLGIASALAAGMLVITSNADARTTKIEITSRTIAFGGYSFDGVGQYERIVGIASGEVDPTDPKNAVIVDIALAPRNASGKVEYQHNFYILKPLDLSKGNHKMMYEPPNRGGKTYQTLNRSPGGNDPGVTITDPVALANSFLWPRGYTTVWSGWEDLQPLTSLTATMTLPDRKGSGQRDDYRPLIRVHRILGDFVHAELSGGRGGQWNTDASRSPGRPAGGGPRVRLGVHERKQDGDSPVPGRNALCRERHLRVRRTRPRTRKSTA